MILHFTILALKRKKTQKIIKNFHNNLNVCWIDFET